MSEVAAAHPKRRLRLLAAVLVGIFVIPAAVLWAFSMRPIQPLEPNATEKQILSVVSRVINEEARRARGPRDEYYDQAAILGNRWWLDTRSEAISRQQQIAHELRRHLEQWQSGTQGMSRRIEARLIELRVPTPMVQETVAGASRGIAAAQPLFDLRFAQLDDLDAMLALLTSAPWDSAGGRVVFKSPADQTAFDALVKSIDDLETQIEAMNEQVKSQRSR